MSNSRKQKNKILISTVLVTILCLGSSCQKNQSGGTTTGNPVTLSMTGSGLARTIAKQNFIEKLIGIFLPVSQALPPPPSLLDSNNLTVNLTQAWVVMKEVEFKTIEISDASEVDGVEIALPGPYLINLFATKAEEFGSANINLTEVRRIKMKLSKYEVVSDGSVNYSPTLISGKSIYFAGSVNNNNFTFTSSEETEYEVGGPNALNATATTNSNLLVSINFANLIRKLNLSAITSGIQINENNRVSTAQACPLIDSSAADIYTCILKGLKSEANLGKDADGSGELESDEESVH